MNGHKLKKTVDPSASLELTVEEASHYEPEELTEEPDIPGDGGSSSANISRSDAMEHCMCKNRIATLKLDIQESEIKISPAFGEKDEPVRSFTVNWTVQLPLSGDPVTGTPEDDSSVFMSVKNKDGYYVVGKVGELLLDSVKREPFFSAPITLTMMMEKKAPASLKQKLWMCLSILFLLTAAIIMVTAIRMYLNISSQL